ncbi:glycerol-3-phosphate dehydrogenase (NAD(P)+) [Flexibacter flexilis DSM 6793]|uniref:Glycerol-3-phosphate dehydrogenase [NAD(P)+] n=1 Tax=Flexibacter flexilis DSM 6793 TaxID=927664 RepID=A0A1I1E8C0_9BACT|nr:NAD(P)H-dependent glycerol-3-phosphate dehydrogenase [Flexibacter flexilis]SFB82946.1 glycerol-3-phosphate dehydrogenase (NAD(P)+) [Flexibacter flexilis DSM 6793]
MNTSLDTVPRVAVVGGGSWATAIVKILCEQSVKIRWWLRKPEDVAHISHYHHNPSYLTDVQIDTHKVEAHSDLKYVLSEADFVVLAVPAAFVQSALQGIDSEDLQGKVIVSAIKGMIPERNILVTDYVEQYYNVPPEQLCIIAGPCHAEEVALERQSYLTIAGYQKETAERFAALLNCRYIKATVNTDLYGVEYAAVIKNIVAIACGICHGLNHGDNFQAVLVSNAMQEIKCFLDTRFPLQRDVNSSAYMGDLLVTAYSQFSRNRTFGNMIGRGYSVKSAQVEMNMIAEGYYAVQSLYQVNQKYGAQMPIMEAVYKILYEKKSAQKEIDKLRKQLS